MNQLEVMLVGGAQDGNMICLPIYAIPEIIAVEGEANGKKIIYIYRPRLGVCECGEFSIMMNEEGQLLADLERIDEV